jgi:hypothetical protein
MLQKETKDLINIFFFNLGIIAVNEANNKLEEDDKSKLRLAFEEVKDRLIEEREVIEDYISDNYPFPEKEIKKGPKR